MKRILVLTLLCFDKMFCYPEGFYSPEFAINPDKMNQYVFKPGVPKMWFVYVQALVENSMNSFEHKYDCLLKMIKFVLKKVSSMKFKIKQLNFTHVIPEEEEDEHFWFRRLNWHLYECYAHYHIVSISLANKSGI